MRVVPGRFEVGAREATRVAAFFRDAFGWDVAPVAWAGGIYLSLEARGGEVVAGVGEALGWEGPLVVLDLAEGRLEEALSAVEAAGGEVVAAPAPVGVYGRFARVRDPEGHQYGLWEAADH